MTFSDSFGDRGLNLRNRKVSVIGAARSGIAAALTLERLGARVVLSDSQTAGQLGKDRVDAIASTGISFVPGATVLDAIPEGTDLVVTSPGVWRTADVLKAAAERAVPIWSEIELAYRISPSRIIATTGTNGKTTTTLLITSILQHAGIDAIAAGNISADNIKKTLVEAALEAFDDRDRDRVLIAEISSFQLEWTSTFAPWIGLLLNVTPDHLNRHADFMEYFTTKTKLFAYQTERDWAVLNYDDETIRLHGLHGTCAGRVWISAVCCPSVSPPRAYVKNREITVELAPGQPVRIMATSDIPATLPGNHNVFNVLAGATAATIAGVDPQTIATAVRTFAGVPHRMELVAEIGGVRYINNSMCTNVAASIASLDAIGRPTIVIAGGADKATQFSELTVALKRCAKLVILIGTAADLMEAAFRAGGYNSIYRAGSLEDAVEKASGAAAAGEAVVLSPACASFDMFRDFEARGEAFRAAVKRLGEE